MLLPAISHCSLLPLSLPRGSVGRLIFWLSDGAVTSAVTSSAYPITDVLARPLLMPSPMRYLSSVLNNGLRQMPYSNMFIGRPCLKELLIGMGLDRKSFTCMTDVALLYIFLVSVTCVTQLCFLQSNEYELFVEFPLAAKQIYLT